MIIFCFKFIFLEITEHRHSPMLHPCKQSHLHPTASNVRPPKKIANKTIPNSP